MTTTMHKGDDKFYIDEGGNLVGPGFLIRREDLVSGRAVIADAEMLNGIYRLGMMAGRTGADAEVRRRKERIEGAIADLTPDDP